MSLIGTVSSPMDARHSPCDTSDPAAPSVPETGPFWATSQTLNILEELARTAGHAPGLVDDDWAATTGGRSA